jgi:hypothetical protein
MNFARSFYLPHLENFPSHLNFNGEELKMPFGCRQNGNKLEGKLFERLWSEDEAKFPKRRQKDELD